MKKITVLVTAAIATISVLNGSAAFASSPSPADQRLSEQVIQPSDSSDYMKFTGVISEVKQNEESLTLIVEDQEKSQMILLISGETLLLNGKTTEELQKQTLEKGLNISAYYDKHKPMIMIYPPRIAPELIVVNDKEMGQVKISKFNEDFLSADNELKLNLSESTVLINEQGEPIQREDLHGTDLVVFYDVSKRSIPAQTTPKKIIALGNVNELAIEVAKLTSEDHYTKDGTNMIPIRKMASKLGYKVEWHQESLSLIVSKQNLSFQISVGAKEYAYNGSVRFFDVTPEIKNGKTYVPDEFLKLLSGDGNKS